MLFLLSCINKLAGPAVWRRSGLGRHFVGATFLVRPAIFLNNGVNAWIVGGTGLHRLPLGYLSAAWSPCSSSYTPGYR